MTVLRVNIKENLYKSSFDKKENIFSDLQYLFKELKPMDQWSYDWMPHYEIKEIFLDVEQLEKLSEDIFDFITIKPLKKVSFSKELPDLSVKDIDIKNVKDVLAKTLQVHLPSNELLRIKEVIVEDDLCTDELQKKLDDGFKILAILPQAGQRRPDYVLGR